MENKKLKSEIRSDLIRMLEDMMTSYYVRQIPDDMVDDMVDNIYCASAAETEGYYNDDDIRMEIGRTFLELLEN